MQQWSLLTILVQLALLAVVAHGKRVFVGVHEPETHELLDKLAEYEIHRIEPEEDHPGRRLLASKGEASLRYELEYKGRKLSLALERNDKLFADDYQHWLQDENGELVAKEDEETNCFYRVTVDGESEAFGSITLCGPGIRGTFRHRSLGHMSVQPLDREGVHHVVFRHEHLNDEEHEGSSCGINHDNMEYYSRGDDFHYEQKMQRVREEADVPGTHYHHHHHHDHHDHVDHHAFEHFLKDPTMRGYNKFIKVREDSQKTKNGRSLLTGGAQKLIRILIVNDKTRYDQYTTGTHASSANMVAQVNDLYSSFPGDYSISFQLVGMLTLSIEDGWTNTIESGEVDADLLLPNFRDWRKSKTGGGNFPTDYGVAHLLSGIPFMEATIGLAYVSNLCNINKDGITQANNLADAIIVSTIAHEVGHNLGMSHTNAFNPEYQKNTNGASTTCESGVIKQIMDESSAGTAHTLWSDCSRDWVKIHFEGYTNPPAPVAYPTPDPVTIVNNYGQSYDVAGYPKCAEYCLPDDPPSFTPEPGCTVVSYWFSGEVCGDGFREGSEECDCINQDCSGIDPCCDGSTCTLLSGKECSAMDGCCDSSTCTIKESGTTCRAATGECDLAETCDGTLAACPTDIYSQTGTPCTATGQPGICYYKECHSHYAQCKEAEPNISPPTPLDGDCDAYDADDGDDSCGSLSCHPTGAGPTTCVTLSLGVDDGTQCDSGKACYGGDCIEYSELPLPGALNCSNGIQDNEETDIDCGGGQCFGCGPGKNCTEDLDCIYPSVCNFTAAALEYAEGSNTTAIGFCTGSLPRDPLCPICPAWLNDILEWLYDNIAIVAPIAGTLLLLVLLYCCWPRSSDDNVGSKQSQGMDDNTRRQLQEQHEYDQAVRASLQQSRTGQVGQYVPNDPNSYPVASFG